MSQEGQLVDQKSLRSVIGKCADWNELVKDCIALGLLAQHDAMTARELAAVLELPSGAVRFEGDKRWRRYWAVS